MRIAMLSSIAWRTPPRHYGPWQRVTSLLTEELLRRGHEVTLFATGDSVTAGKLEWVAERGYEEDRDIDPKVWECLHVARCFEKAGRFDLIHNHFDFLPLTYCKLIGIPMVTTIHGFSSERILPVYKAYNGISRYVAISDADRDPALDYIATIHHGIDIENFTFVETVDDRYLLYFGRIHPDKGAAEAIEIARRAQRRLIMAGIVHDEAYFRERIEPSLDGCNVVYMGSAGPDLRNRLLGNATALLHPINFDEPFGLSVVEALACGTPVIAFRRGSMPEIIEHGKTGFLVSDVGEAVECVNRLGCISRKECRRSVELRMTKEIMADRYCDVYSSVLRGG